MNVMYTTTANQLSGDIKLDCDKDTGFSDITTEGCDVAFILIL